VLRNVWILLTDLQGFSRFSQTEQESSVEELLDKLDLLVGATAHELGGTVRFAAGDSHCVTFDHAANTISAADKISKIWAADVRGTKASCPINICLHRGTMKIFRSFAYGPGIAAATRILPRAVGLFGAKEGNVFVTDQVREALGGSEWQSRLRPLSCESLADQLPGLALFRLN
jgi:class 3 adenylate cyclase